LFSKTIQTTCWYVAGSLPTLVPHGPEPVVVVLGVVVVVVVQPWLPWPWQPFPGAGLLPSAAAAANPAASNITTATAAYVLRDPTA
jgi:hypothetical protein